MIELLQGDCLELMKNIPDKSVDLVVTDPPYIIETKGGGICGDNGIVKQFREHHLDGMNNGFSTEVLDELRRIMKRINIYLFCSKSQLPPPCCGILPIR